MLNPFRPVTTAQRLDKQIAMTEESLITNMTNAEHYVAMADGNRKQLMKLRAMRHLESGVTVTNQGVSAANQTDAVKSVKGTKPHLASSK